MTENEQPSVRIDRTGVGLAAYHFGHGVPVLVVHGFASTVHANWVASGWEHALTTEGCQMIGADLRGHGDSDKPHDVAEYAVPLLVGDLLAVLDEFRIRIAVDVIGYSLGARLAVELALAAPGRVRTLTLGGAGLATPLREVDVAATRGAISGGGAPSDAAAASVLSMAHALPGNDVHALLCAVEAMQLEADLTELPDVPLIVVNGERDTIAPDGKDLARRAPQGRFISLPSRTHTNAVSSRTFKQAALSLIHSST